MSPPDPIASERKLRAKRNNERVKLLATTLNALALGVAGAGVVVPGVTAPEMLLKPASLVWVLVAGGLHSGAQVVLQLLKSED